MFFTIDFIDFVFISNINFSCFMIYLTLKNVSDSGPTLAIYPIPNVNKSYNFISFYDFFSQFYIFLNHPKNIYFDKIFGKSCE